MVMVSLPACAPEPLKFGLLTTPPYKFTFTTGALPHRPFKRARALSDVDGDDVNRGRKKRRLRLHLVTSRLSRPFSAPASNIANRGGYAKNLVLGGGGKRLGVRQHHGKNMLRKLAILNRMRLEMEGARNFMKVFHGRKEHGETGMGVYVNLREIVTGINNQNKRWNEFVLPSSPLGRSNYDALDLEDEMMMAEEGNENGRQIYSDFNVMCPSGGDGDDYEYLDTLDGLSPEDIQDQPPNPPSEERIVEILREEERQHDSYFVEVGGYNRQ
ncbi:hypothetical protein DSL72_009506 [Monilinia vaccinii-corymbosi]|uniref:Uncharacterized protein n=1 Tax=Monilinia vaccinii-corymbosi TaxID=61207 RepID=A0A8A3PPN9_9HELO|nr:hypothetical protein DSL72_009506 [Monilinia vaccinii-corymbosi]